MNEIFLDTETTGLSLKENHRIVEIACIETKDLIPTKNFFHKLINPDRDVPEDAVKVHGFTGEFLKDKDKFEKKGMIFSGLSPDNKLPEIVELKNHPWFIGVQFHPEFKSRPLSPHPLFSSFIKAAKNRK